MPITIGSNIQSLKGQRQLLQTSSALSSTFERLSSGLRINRASDDAAGLAIADQLNASSRIYTQGVRNLSDGISLLNIADSALSNLSDIVTRLKELAAQSANGVYSTTQRKALDNEAQSLSDEYFRIAKSTRFNGVDLFNGDLTDLNLQGGVGLAAVLSLGVGGEIGTGEFSGSLSSAISLTSPTSVQAADLNGDGILDSVAIADDSLHVLFGRGDGTFYQASSKQLLDAGSEIALGDFNGDGVFDLVIGALAETTVEVLIGRGDGTFQSVGNFVAGGSLANEVQVADFNSDGRLDIVATNRTTSSVGVLLGDGTGNFSAVATYGTGGSPSDVEVGDFNNDGITDLITSDESGNSVSVLLGNGDGTFKARVSLVLGGAPDLFDIEVGDFNGDGLLDFAAADYNHSRISYAFGNGNGTFGSAQALNYASGDPNTVELGDFNGDGFLDIAATLPGANNELTIFLNRGNGTFEEPVTYKIGTTPASITVGDLDNDGVLDILNVSNAASGVRVFLGTSTDGVAPLLDFSLKTSADARQALSQFSSALQRLSTQRGEIGAHLSRISVASAVLESSNENFKAAKSRIRDADIASDSAKLTQLTILQEAAAAVLGQANLQPELALKLIST